jgi:hypothetical protein
LGKQAKKVRKAKKVFKSVEEEEQAEWEANVAGVERGGAGISESSNAHLLGKDKSHRTPFYMTPSGMLKSGVFTYACVH